MYKIFETDGFCADLKQDFQGRQMKIKKKLREYIYPQLKKSSCFGLNIKKLRGYLPPTWRYRIGAYRFFYQIDEENKIVIMTAAAHRARSY